MESTQLTNDLCHVHHYVRILERGGEVGGNKRWKENVRKRRDDTCRGRRDDMK